MTDRFLGLSASTPPKNSVDLSEFIALRIIVMALAADIVVAQSLLGGSPQKWLNIISARCQESALAGEFAVDGDRESGERLKTDVLEQINRILGGISVPREWTEVD
jgi:hypothetical protein